MFRRMVPAAVVALIALSPLPGLADEGRDHGVIQILRVESALSRDDVIKVAAATAADFETIPGLKQKYYVELGEPNHYGAVYVWESRDAMMAFLETDFARTMGDAYQLTSTPTVEVLSTVFELRD
ncbi:MAG: hypothetical protein KDK07_16110 [Bauldia sp.]|nr:hypothetical protein [Bauldia sp.]